MNTEKENKKSYCFWLYPETDEKIDAHLRTSHCRSRSEFINDAVDFYCCELDESQHRNVIATETARIIRDNIQNLENHMAYILYKIAGEQANMGLLLADQLLNLPVEAIREYRNDAYDLIRKRSGFISFEDAMDNAKQIAAEAADNDTDESGVEDY